MNFVGKFDAQLPSDGFDAHSHVHVEHPTAHAPADAIIIPDAHLLFGADFKRDGVDLILSNADRELVVHDYFKGEHRHPLASPDGAHLTGDIVTALTGQVQVAQAAGAPDAVAHVIGHVTKLSGSATAIRNGVSVILNNGDNVEKGDVVATGSDSTLGVTFIDGTVFGLASNARMVLNEMVYDPNGSNNSSLISLVAGTISFVAGETAKHGDMKVDTPVATMGIRGTAVLVEIDFNVPGQNGLPDAKFQVLVEPDGTTGSYILFDKTTLDPIATVNRAGQQVNINQNGVSYSNSPLSAELQKLISDVFSQKFSNTDTNTKLVEHFTDSIVPPSFVSFQGPNNIVVTEVFLQTNSLGSGPSQTQGPSSDKQHVNLAPTVSATNGSFGELPHVTGSTHTDAASGYITFSDVNLGDQPTASAKFQSFAYQNAQHADISKTLTPTEQAAVQAVEVALNITQDPTGLAAGTALWGYSLSDSAFDFLGAGETLTLTYLVTVSNNYAQSVLTTTVPITITITGTNDVPVITSAVPQTIAFVGGTNVAGGDLTPHVPTSGTITFDDPDLTDTHTVSVAAPTATLTDPTTHVTTPFTLPPTPLAIFDQALTASITDSTGTGFGSISWNLAALPVWLGDFIPENEVLTLTYPVTVTDSQGATATQDITVTITGTDTPAVVWIATTGTGPAPDGLWSTGVNWETGNVPTASDDVIIITDQLEGLTPTYPVTITSAVGPNGAFANNLVMDNFGGNAPELINQNTLQVFGVFTIQDHSTGNPAGYVGPELNNQGTLSIGGALNLLNDAVLVNSGGIGLWGGGIFGGTSSITNTSTATLAVSGGTLNVDVNIANAGQIAINGGGALTLAGAAINGGTIINDGTLTLNGNAIVENGTLYNVNVMNVSGTGNALINETIYANPIYLIPQLHYNPGKPTVPNPNQDSGGDDDGDGAGVTITVVDLASASAFIDAYAINVTGALTLNETSIDSGLITSTGTIDVTGNSAINAEMTGGQMTVESGVVLTTDVTAIEQATITNKGTISVDANDLLTLADVTLTGGKILNSGTIEIVDTAIFAGFSQFVIYGPGLGPTPATTAITDTTITNNLLTIEGGNTLALSGTTVNGGTINNFSAGETSGSIVAGDIDVTGSSTISNAALNKGNVAVEANVTLNLDGSTVTGTSFDDTASGATIQLDGGDTLTLSGVTINGGAIDAFTSVPSGATIAGDIDVTGSSTISNVHLNDGNVTLGSNVTLNLDGSTVTGASFNDTASGAIIQLDGGDTLTLSGATINGGTINAFTTTSGGTVAGDIDVTGSSTISNADLNNGSVTLSSNVTLTLDGTTVTGTSFADTASGATIQLDGGDTLTLSGVTINGGAIDAFTSVPSGATIAGDIDVTGSSTISNVHLNDGNVTLGSNVTLNLDGSTVTGASFNDTASGATIQLDGGDTLTLSGATINGGTINAFTTTSGGTVAGDIDVTGNSTISNADLNNGSVTLSSNVTLNVDGTTLTGTSFADTASGATIQLDGGDTLTLKDVTINGGAIDAFTSVPSGAAIAGDIDVTGASTISNAALNNGAVTFGNNVTLTLTNDVVTGASFADTASGATIQIIGNTTLDDVTINGGAVTNSFDGVGTTITIGSGHTLLLQQGVTITGGTIDNLGTLDIEGSVTATLDDVTITGGGLVQVDGVILATPTPLVLEGGTQIDGGTLVVGNMSGDLVIESAAGATLDHVGVTNNRAAEVASGSILTLDDGAAFGNGANGTLTIDGGATLALNDASITGGAVDNSSTINVTGSSKFDTVHLNDGDVTVGGNVTLTLANDTVAGTSFSDTASGATIQIVGDTVLDGVTVSGGTVTNSFDGAGTTITVDSRQTLTLQDGVTVSGGTIDSAGTLDIESSAGATLNGVIVNGGGAVQVDGVTPVASTPLVLEGGTEINDVTLTVGATSGSVLIETAAGATFDNVEVTNDRAIEVTSGSVLTLDDGTSVGNGMGTLTVDGGATLKLNDASITGGIINDFSAGSASGSIVAGDIDVTGSSAINNAGLNNGNVTVDANQTLKLDGDTVSGASLDATASGATIQVDSGDTLTLEAGASIAGHLYNSGTVDFEGTGASLGGVTITGPGKIEVDGSTPQVITTLTVEGTTSFTDGTLTVGPTGVLSVAGATTLDDVGITNQNSIEITATGAVTLDDGASVGNTAGTLTIDGGGTLVLNDAEISGGIINSSNAGGNGTIDVTGSSEIDSGATLNDGNVKVEGVTLTLDNVTVNGTDFDDTASGATLQVDGGDTLSLSGATINGGVIDNFSAGLNSHIEISSSSTISNADLNNGSVTLGGDVTLNLDGTTVTGTSFDDTASGATIQLDGLDTLTLNDVTITSGAISNAGTIDIRELGATLNGVTIAGGGAVDVDGPTPQVITTLTLEGVTSITDGTLTVGPTGVLSVTGSATLDDVDVTSQNSIEVTATGSLTLDDGASVDNTAGKITIDNGGTLALNGASIDGGSISDLNTVDLGLQIDGSSTISNAQIGGVELASANVTLNLDGTTVSGNVDIKGNGGTVQIDGGSTLTLNNVVADNVVFDNFSTDATGNIIAGDIDFVAHGSSIDDGTTFNKGNVTIGAGVEVTLSDVTVNGSHFDDTANNASIEIDSNVTLNGATINGGTIFLDNGAGDPGIIVAGSSTISNAVLNDGGNVTVGTNATLTLDGDTVNGTSFDATASGATLSVDSGANLNFVGATVSGGELDVGGTLNSTGTSAITGADITIAEGGTVEATGGKLTISSASINNGGTLEAKGGTLVLDGASVPAVADNFVTDSALNAAWTISSPNSASSVTLVPGTGLEISASYANGGSDLFSGSNYNAPVVLRAIDPTLNWTIETKLDFSPTNNYQGAGILLATTTGPFTSSSQFSRIDERADYPGGGGQIVEGAGGSEDYSASSIYLEVTKIGDSYTSAYSSDGINWTVLGTTTSPTAFTEIGLFTLGQPWDGQSGASQATFEFFDVDVLPSTTLTNSGTLEATADGTLVLNSEVVSNTGTIQIDGGSELTLNGSTISGGAINDFSGPSGSIVAGDIDVTGNSTINGNAALNQGNLTVESGVTLTLDDVTVTGTSFDLTATGATIQIDGGDTLTLNGANFNGGTIDAFSAGPSGSIIAADIDVTGSSTISNATLNNGDVTLGTNVTLNLDGTTVNGTTFTDTASGATVQIDGGDTLTLNGANFNGGTIDAFSAGPSGSIIAADVDVIGSSTISNATLNNGDVTLSTNVALNLDGTTVNGTTFTDTASGATVQIDGGDTLTLNGANFNGGVINDFSLNASGTTIAGDIDVTGSSGISNATLNDGHVTIESGIHLGFDNATVSGTSFDDTTGTIDVAGTLTLDDVNIQGGTIHNFSTDASGDIIANDIDVTGTSTIGSAALNGGDVTVGTNVMLTLDGSTVTGTSFDLTASGATIQVDGFAGDTLTLNGVTVTGGAIVDTGTIDTTGSNTINGVTFSGGAAAATGVINNSGTLTLGAGGLILAGSNYTFELDGTGTLNLAGNTIKMNTVSGDTFINNGNTISGAGKIGTGNQGTTPLIVDNEAGTIEAIGGILAISNGGTFTNAGLLEAASTGTLDITIGGIQNTGANPLAASNAGGILLYGTLEVDNPLGSQAAGSLALNGGGAVVLSGGTIEGNSSNAEILVNTNNTIFGSGTIGVSGDQLTLTNKASGVIDANSAGHALTINAATANAGVMEATNGGTLQIDANVTGFNGTIGSIKADAGTVVIGANAAVAGSVTITDGGAAEFVGSATQTLSLKAAFSGTGTLQLDNSQHYNGMISGFAAGDTVKLMDLAYSTSETDVWNAGTNTLTINNGTTTEALHFAGTFNPGNFALTQDASGDTEIVFAPATAAASVSGYDSAGNAVAGSMLTASFTDATETGNATYTWVENGVVVGTGNTYTPGAAEAGKALDVVVGFTDNGVTEQVTSAVGFVANAPLASAGATSVSTDAGTPVKITTLDVTFADAGSDSFTVTLDAGHGTLSLAAANGVTESGLGSSEVTLTGTLANIDAALANGVTYTPGSGFPGSDALTIHAVDDNGGFASNTASVNVNVAPDFTGMSMAVAQGATEVLSDSNFSFTNTDVSHLTYTVSNLSGGQFEVFSGSTWTTATSFTTAEVEAGHVEFVQDGTLTTPNFSIVAADGAYGSATVTPNVDFTAVPPTVSLVTLQDGSFETPDLGQGNFQYAPTGSAWTFSVVSGNDGGGGIAGNDSGFTLANPDAPDGDQVAFLQSRDGNSGETIRQTFDASAGSFTLDFEAAQRGNGSFNPQTFEVLVDNNVVGSFDPSGTNYSSFSANVVLTTSGAHTLTFEALDGNNSTDATALIDNVALVANSLTVAENATLGITGLTVNSPDVESNSISVTLDVNHGGLSLANAAGLTESGLGTTASPLILTGSLAAIDAALAAGVNYAPNADFSGADTLTLVASDGGHVSNTETLNINVDPGTPDFTAMTMTIAQGGTEVLSDSNFNITDPDTTHFLYSVSNVTGGEFEVFNGTNWVDAPTGGFTTQQIEAGHVEFVQDGTATAPSFSITAADGTNVSAAIAPTVTFAAAPADYLSFNGSSAAIGPVATSHVGNADGGTGSDAATLQGWLDWNGAGDSGHNQVLIYNGNTSFDGFGVFGTPTGSGSLDLLILAGGAEGIDTGVTLTAGQWYNVSLSHANGIFTLDVNGQVVYTSDAEGANTLGHQGDAMLVGGNLGGAEGFNGSMADVSVWNTALTQSQIQANEFTALTGNESGLAAYFPLNDGSGTTAQDATNSAGNLSITGTTDWHTGTIASGGSLEISDAVTPEHIVVFQGSTGSLTLDNPSSFDGVITGFTGDGTLSGSDQIDLKGIDYNSTHFSESFDAADDTLLVTDGTDSATLHFNGTYQAANFKFTTDNAGGTIVYDPPVPANAPSNAGANTPPVTSNGHGFVFNFADNGHDIGNHPAADGHLFDHQMTTDAGAALNKLHDDSHVVPSVAPVDSHDVSGAAGIKAQWHAADFHFV